MSVLSIVILSVVSGLVVVFGMVSDMGHTGLESSKVSGVVLNVVSSVVMTHY